MGPLWGEAKPGVPCSVNDEFGRATDEEIAIDGPSRPMMAVYKF